MNITRVSWLLVIIFVAVSAWIIAVPASNVLAEATNFAEQIDFIFKFMLVASVAVFLIVEGFLLYFVLRYRQRPEDGPDPLGSDIHGNTRLEIVWTIIPAIFLVVLTAMSTKVYADIVAQHSDAYIINARAFQFGWECDHPAYTYTLNHQQQVLQEFSACHMPYNRDIKVNLRSDDVVHSFWAPEFRVKQDAVPGYPTRMNFKTTRVGQYRLICSELCGVGHSKMVAPMYICYTDKDDPKLVAKSDACDHMTFDAWARAQVKAAMSGGNVTDVSFKTNIQPIFGTRCAACHISTNLGGLSLTNYQGLLKGGLIVPGSIVKAGDHAHSVLWQMVQASPPYPGGNRMPLGGPTYLSDAQIKTIAAWIDQGAKNN